MSDVGGDDFTVRGSVVIEVDQESLRKAEDEIGSKSGGGLARRTPEDRASAEAEKIADREARVVEKEANRALVSLRDARRDLVVGGAQTGASLARSVAAGDPSGALMAAIVGGGTLARSGAVVAGGGVSTGGLAAALMSPGGIAAIVGVATVAIPAIAIAGGFALAGAAISLVGMSQGFRSDLLGTPGGEFSPVIARQAALSEVRRIRRAISVGEIARSGLESSAGPLEGIADAGAQIRATLQGAFLNDITGYLEGIKVALDVIARLLQYFTNGGTDIVGPVVDLLQDLILRIARMASPTL